MLHTIAPRLLSPITRQTVGVLIIGAAYGAWRGAVTMTAYMVVGLRGRVKAGAGDSDAARRVR